MTKERWDEADGVGTVGEGGMEGSDMGKWLGNDVMREKGEGRSFGVMKWTRL